MISYMIKNLGQKDVSGFLALKEYSEAYIHVEYLNIFFNRVKI